MKSFNIKYNIILLLYLLITNNNADAQVRIIDQNKFNIKNDEVRNIHTNLFGEDFILVKKQQNHSQTNQTIVIKNRKFNDEYYFNLPIEETIQQFRSNNLLTVKKNSSVDEIEIKKYTLDKGRLTENNSIKLSSIERSIMFSNDGGLTISDEGEAGGYQYNIYNNNFVKTLSYIPYKDGYDFACSSISKDLLFMGVNPKGPKNPKIAYIHINTGRLLFEKVLSGDPSFRIYKVQASKKYLAIYRYSIQTNKHIIEVFEDNGRLLWRKEVHSQVNHISINEGEKPTITLGFQDRIYLKNILTGNFIDEKSFSKILHDANLTHNRNDRYIEIVGLEKLENGTTALLLAEPIGKDEYKNLVYYSYQIDFKTNNKIASLGTSLKMPKLLKSQDHIYILKDSEIISYEF